MDGNMRRLAWVTVIVYMIACRLIRQLIREIQRKEEKSGALRYI